MKGKAWTPAAETALMQILLTAKRLQIHTWSDDLSGVVAYLIGSLMEMKPGMASYYYQQFTECGILHGSPVETEEAQI